MVADVLVPLYLLWSWSPCCRYDFTRRGELGPDKFSLLYIVHTPELSAYMRHHCAGLVHRDEDAKDDSDKHREGDRLDEYA